MVSDDSKSDLPLNTNIGTVNSKSGQQVQINKIIFLISRYIVVSFNDINGSSLNAKFLEKKTFIEQI